MSTDPPPGLTSKPIFGSTTIVTSRSSDEIDTKTGCVFPLWSAHSVSCARDHEPAPSGWLFCAGASVTLANLTACGTVRITLELTPDHSAGLARVR